ncbi:FAD-binding oxidoreductase [Albidovulum sp.]|uniref:FAD-binding oxidoreductase n=2 Tax=Albidovulum sp. TaxID=1872424 RepID=UPI00302785B5
MLNPADAAFAASLAARLPEGTLAPAGPRDLDEPRGRGVTPAALLARPRSVEEVVRIVRACAAARVGIVPRGGGTGLVLGQVMPEGQAPLILSLDRMAACRGLWPEEGLMIAEAGMTLAAAQAAAEAAGLLLPLSLASEGSAQLGGVLATNAGGTAVLRYGTARALCLGVEAVLADGSVFNGLKRLRKDNTGYDLSGLLVGSEGTLGILTAAVLRLHPRPAARATTMLVVADPGAALALLRLVQDRTGGAAATFELIGGQGLRFLDEVMPEVRQPFAARPDWSVLIELGLPPGLEAEPVLAGIYAAAEDAGLVSDAIMATTGAQREALWALREMIPVANRRIGAVASHDISLPLSEIAAFLPRAQAAVRSIYPFRINVFGHLGDGNLHYNIFPPAGEDRAGHAGRAEAVTRAVHDLVHDHGGSVSAEHGIGRLKAGELVRYADPAKLMAMRAIKQALDPQGILNPGAVLAV